MLTPTRHDPLNRDTELEFRSVQDSDYSAWLPLWMDYVGPYAATIPSAQHALTFSRLCAADFNLWGLLAFHNHRAVGLAHFQWQHSSFSAAPSCYLEDLFVSPAARGQGVARKLIDELRRLAYGHGAQSIHWKTREDNIAARRLYDSLAERTNYVTYRSALG